MDELITTAEVAKILKCNRNTVYDFIKAGLLPRMKFGVHNKCSRLAVDEFIKKYQNYDLSDPFNIKLITN